MSNYETKRPGANRFDRGADTVGSSPGKHTLVEQTYRSIDVVPGRTLDGDHGDGRGQTSTIRRTTPPATELPHDNGLESAFRSYDVSSDQPRASAPAPVQRRATGPADGDVHSVAARGIASPATALPFASQIQASFGPRHDVTSIHAHVGGAASEAASAMGASAYATGDHTVFANTPDLHTAAHEAAHVFQQRSGVHLHGGVGQMGDPYERHADAVADAVVAGRSAADLLDQGASVATSGAAVQRKALSPEEVKKQIKAVGLSEINEMVDHFPGVLWDDKEHVVKKADQGGTAHEWTIKMHMNVGGTGGAVTTPLPAVEHKTAGKISRVTHPITIGINQTMSPFVEAVLHELLHARLEVDRGLPEGDRSETSKRFSQMQQLATDKALLAVTKTTPQAEALRNALAQMTTWFSSYVDPAVVSAPKFKIDALYEFLLEEQFVGKAAAGAFKHTKANKDIATIYAEAILGDLKRSAQAQGMFDKFQAAYAKSPQQGLLDMALTNTMDAAHALYNALDVQRQEMEKAKGSPGAPGSVSPLAELTPGLKADSNVPGKPVGIGGGTVP